MVISQSHLPPALIQMLLGRFALSEGGQVLGMHEEQIQDEEQEPSAYLCQVIFPSKALGSLLAFSIVLEVLDFIGGI